MERFSDLKKMAESKDSIINRMDLTDEQKKTAKDFFNKHNDYEKEIDWNKWRTLTWDDLSEVIYKDRDTRSQMSKKVKGGIEGIVEGKDYEVYGEGELEGEPWVAYYPMTWLGSRTLASNSVPPVVEGNGSAEWCISYQKEDSYWKDHSRHEGFLFFCGESIPTKKIAISVEMCDYSKDANGFEYEYRTPNGTYYNIWDYHDNENGQDFEDEEDSEMYYSLIDKLYNEKHSNYHKDNRSDVIEEYSSMDGIYAYEELIDAEGRENDHELEHFDERYLFEVVDTYETMKMLIQDYDIDFDWEDLPQFCNVRAMEDGIEENTDDYEEGMTSDDVIEYIEENGVADWMKDIKYVSPWQFLDFCKDMGIVYEYGGFLFRPF